MAIGCTCRRMPRFYFHLHDDLDAPDDCGADLPDLEAARAYAIANARDVACESIAKGHLNLEHFIEVTGDDGAPLLRVRFGDAVVVTGRS